MARRCGYCYGQGHNKRTCPQITESYIRRYQAETGENKEYYAQHIRKRGVNPDTGKALTAKEKTKRTGYAKQARRCKYCNEGGHNSATCTTKKSDIKLINEVAKEFRIAAVEKINSADFPKTGTLVQYHHPREWMGSRDGYMAISEVHMLGALDWNKVTFERAHGGYTDWFQTINLGAPGRTRHAGQQVWWRVDKVRRHAASGKISDAGWCVLSNPAEMTPVPKPSSEWWDTDHAATERCRFIQTGVKRNDTQMKLFACALAAVKDGRDLDMSNPRSWATQLEEWDLWEY